MSPLSEPLYPAYILEAGSSVISLLTGEQDTDIDMRALDIKAWTAKKIAIYTQPSFTVWKSFVLDKEHQLDQSRHAFTSPLFSWSAASLDEALPTMLSNAGLPGAPSILEAVEDFDKDRWVKETVTTIDRQDIHFKYAPSGPLDVQSQEDTVALKVCLASFICMIARDHNDYQRLHPGKSIWLLISTIRVRDIVLYRNFKKALETASMTSIGIITDNLLGLDRKEARDEAIMAFCASCSKLNRTHMRCTGCQAAYYCSHGCQRLDWKNQHKTECKERQKDQEEWNNTLIALGHRKL